MLKEDGYDRYENSIETMTISRYCIQKEMKNHEI